MSDSITDCTKYVCPDGTLDHYEIIFLFDGNSPKSTTVILGPSDLTNPLDLNEVKTKACELASHAKSTLSYQISLVKSSITDFNGPVIL